jgi:hypothetical protein
VRRATVRIMPNRRSGDSGVSAFLSLLEQRAPRPLTIPEMARMLGLERYDKRALKAALEEELAKRRVRRIGTSRFQWVREGVAPARQQRSSGGQKSRRRSGERLVEGHYSRVRAGYGFVEVLGRAADFWGAVVGSPGDGMMKGLGGFALLLLLRVIVRRDFIAWLGLWALFVGGSVVSWNLSVTTWIGLVTATACLLLAARVGVVAAMTAFTATSFLSLCGPLTLDFSRWYAWRTGVIAVLLLAMAVWGFRAAMGRRRILPASMLEG